MPSVKSSTVLGDFARIIPNETHTHGWRCPGLDTELGTARKRVRHTRVQTHSH